MPELILNLGSQGGPAFDLVTRADGGIADPIAAFTPPLTPADFLTQFPTQLPTEEILAMCEEVTLLQYLPEVTTNRKIDTWQELNELAFLSGTNAISFDGDSGDCPAQYKHDGDPFSMTKKNYGAMKTLAYTDILDSIGAIQSGQGIRGIYGPNPAGEGMPGAYQVPAWQMAQIADLKEKEVLLGEELVLNGLDNLLVNGNASSNSLEFSGIVKLLESGSGVHENSTGASGTFSAASFDRFLSEGCAKPTALMGHPSANQEMLSAYFQLGFAGSQIISTNNPEGIVPGYNFAAWVNTGIGRLPLVSDTNFPRTNVSGGMFQSTIYGLRMSYNGAKLVYRATQIPLSWNDLVPGCTTIRFQIWGKGGLTIKHKCAHHRYTALFTGNIVTTCPVIL